MDRGGTGAFGHSLSRGPVSLHFRKCCHVGSLTESSHNEYHDPTLRLPTEQLESN